MTSLEIKQLLDEKYQEYCHSDFFIHTDPIQIPKLFEEKEDIEIAGFLAASLAWGQRPTIIKKCKELMQLLDYAPYDFVLHARESDFARFEHFKHRTFNGWKMSSPPPGKYTGICSRYYAIGIGFSLPFRPSPGYSATSRV